MEELYSLVHKRIHWKGNLSIESEKCPYTNLVHWCPWRRKGRGWGTGSDIVT